MNTMINPPSPDYVASLMQQIKELAGKLGTTQAVLERANDSMHSYNKQISDTKANVESLVHEHLDLEGTEFFDAVVDLFDIELTKYVTLQFTVTLEVQAQVPAGMDEDEVAEELTNATLDYSFWGNGDIVIEDFSFGEMEQE